MIGSLLKKIGPDEASFRRSSSVISPTTLQRATFSVDLALCEVARVRHSEGTWLQFAWSDSSPQANFDWLWTQVREIEKKVLVETFQAALTLAKLVIGISDVSPIRYRGVPKQIG